MQGPDYTHWHGMYEVGKHFYFAFLPEVIEVAELADARFTERFHAELSRRGLPRPVHHAVPAKFAAQVREVAEFVVAEDVQLTSHYKEHGDGWPGSRRRR